MFKEIKNILGTPYYENEYGLLYNEDCISAMKKLPSEIVNLTFTSPPYNIGKEYETIMKIDQYVEWCGNWINEIYRLTKSNGSFWLNVGYLEVPNLGKCVPIAYYLWNISKFYLNQEIVGNYGAGVSCKKRLSPRNEKILGLIKNQDSYTFNLDAIRDKNVKYPKQKKNGKLRCNTLGKNPSDVWQIAKVTSGKNRSSNERTKHPAQTPLDILERIIKGGSNEGDLVLDPFLGSGSCAVSAILNKRKFLGFEINKSYCNIARERIIQTLETL